MRTTICKRLITIGLVMGTIINSTIAEQTKTIKEWTILAFVNADNNLDRYGVLDMQEATRVGSSKDVNIVFQMDRAWGEPCNRYFIEKDNAQPVEEMGEVDMGDINVMVDFLKWGAENYPAKHYALVMWNHGSGWSKKPGTEFKGISYDDDSNNHITTNQLTTGLAEIREHLGQKLDILAFDACLMQMVEVTYAIKDSVDVMIASEETEPGDGWCYESAMAPIIEEPFMGTEKIASAIVRGYDSSYDNGPQGTKPTTQSWVKCEKTDAILVALDAFAVVAEGKERKTIKDALYDVQRFYYRANVDLKHIMTLIAEKTSVSEIATAARNVVNAVDNFVGLSLTNGYKYDNASGTAIYFPQRGYLFDKKYYQLDFTKNSLWAGYLQAFYNAAKTQESDL